MRQYSVPSVEAVGLSSGGQGRLLVTGVNDSIELVDLENQERLKSWGQASGSKLKLSCVACYDESSDSIVVGSSAAAGHEIVFLARDGKERSLADASPDRRVKLPHAPSALHSLKDSEGVVVVLPDGRACRAAPGTPLSAVEGGAEEEGTRLVASCADDSHVAVVTKSNEGFAVTVFQPSDLAMGDDSEDEESEEEEEDEEASGSESEEEGSEEEEEEEEEGDDSGEEDDEDSEDGSGDEEDEDGDGDEVGFDLEVVADVGLLHPTSDSPALAVLAASFAFPNLTLVWSDGTFAVYDVTGEGLASLHRQLACFELGSASANATGAGKTPAGKRKEREEAAASSSGAAVTATAAGVGYVLLCGTATAAAGEAGTPLGVVMDMEYGCVHAVFSLAEEGTRATGRPSCSASLSDGSLVVSVGPEVRVLLPRLPRLSMAAIISLRSRHGVALESRVFALSTKQELLEPAMLVMERPVWKEGLDDEDDEDSDPEAPFLQPVDDPWDQEAMDRQRKSLEASALKLRTSLASDKAYAASLHALLDAHHADKRPLSVMLAREVMDTVFAREFYGALDLFLRLTRQYSLLETVPWPRGLARKLLDARQFSTLQQVLARCSSLHPDDLLDVAAALLRPDLDRESIQALAAFRDQVRARASEQIDKVATLDKPQERQEQLEIATCCAAAVDGFSGRDILLHGLLFAGYDSMALLHAVRGLDLPAVLRLLRYSSRWLRKFQGPLMPRRLALEPTPEEEALPVIPHPKPGQMLPAPLPNAGKPRCPVLLDVPCPTIEQVVQWASAALDTHLPRLVMHPGAAELSQQFAADAKALAATSKHLSKLKGVLEHLKGQAPIPAPAKGTADSDYRITLLDLTVA